MIWRAIFTTVLVATVLGLPTFAQGDVLRVEVTGFVDSNTLTSGPFTGAVAGERVTMRFDVTTAGTVITPTQHEAYNIDAASFRLAIGAMVETMPAGSTSTFDLHNNDPIDDGISIPSAPLTTAGATLVLNTVAARELAISTDIMQWVGSYADTWFQEPRSWRIVASPDTLEFTLNAIHILEYPELPQFRYDIVDLGTLATSNENANSNATGINEAGHVGGIAEDEAAAPHVVIWRDGQIIDLGLGTGKGINDSGQAVGQGSAPNPHGPGYIGVPIIGDELSGMSPIVVEYGWAWGINDSGQVAMSLNGPVMSGSYFWDPVDGPTLIEIPDIWPDGYSEAWEINNAGVVCGGMTGTPFGIHAYRYDSVSDTVEDLHDGVNYFHTEAYGLNDIGDAVGWGERMSDFSHAALVWPMGGGVIELPSTDVRKDLVSGSAEHINIHGDVVGTDDSAIPGLWNEGWVAFDVINSGSPQKIGLTWLIDYEELTTWSLSHAFEINDAGQIAGFGVHEGRTRAFLMTPSGLSSVDLPGSDEIPATMHLHAAVPNPFNPSTTIRFDLPQASQVELTIYDVAGRRVRTLVKESRNAGVHEVIWHGLDEGGRQVVSGVYLYRLTTGSNVQTGRMTLVK